MNHLRKAGQMTASSSTSDDGRLRTIATMVEPEWIDYNEHLTEWAYLKHFGDASDAVLAEIGAGLEYVAGGYSWYTVESHLRHIGQARLGEPIEVRSRVLACDGKRLHLFHEMSSVSQNAVIATAEHMMIHVDATAGKAVLSPQDMQAKAETLAAGQARLPLPDGLGRQIRMPG